LKVPRFLGDVKAIHRNGRLIRRQALGYRVKITVARTLLGRERSPVMARKGLSHIALKVRDLKKTEDFYVRVLGLKIAFRHPSTMIFLTTPGSGDLLNFVKASKRSSGNQGLQHIGFKCTAAALRRMEKLLKEHKVAIDGRRGKSAIYLSDPNGYQIEYYCD
jgi:catechol-2,3-dioxygenase